MSCADSCFSCCGWNDSSGVIEVYSIDETTTLMSFSQIIYWFTCKWLLKGYWLWLPSACTYHANVVLSDMYTLSNTCRNLRAGRHQAWKRERERGIDCLIVDRLHCILLWNKLLITRPFIKCTPINYGAHIFQLSISASDFCLWFLFYFDDNYHGI